MVFSDTKVEKKKPKRKHKQSDSEELSNGNKLRKNVKSKGLKKYKEDKVEEPPKIQKNEEVDKTVDPLIENDVP